MTTDMAPGNVATGICPPPSPPCPFDAANPWTYVGNTCQRTVANPPPVTPPPVNPPVTPPPICPANMAGSPCACIYPYLPGPTATSCISPACPENSTPTAGNSAMCTCTGGLVADKDKINCTRPSNDPAKGNGAPSCGDNQVYGGNPINIGTGLKTQVEIDYQNASGLEFKRVYNSWSGYEAPIQLALGQGWRTDWNRMIQGSPNPPPTYPQPVDYNVYRQGLGPAWIADNTIATAYVARGDGQILTYKRSGGIWQADADINGQLSSQFDAVGKLTGWTYTTPEHDTEQYNAKGQLISIADRVGQVQTLTYSDGTTSNSGGYILDATGAPTATALPTGLLTRITAPYGRSLTLGYDKQSRIVKMTDPAGGVYLYTYDANNNLSTVTYPDGKSKQYLYENTTFVNALTGIVDENGNRFATYAYDNTGRAISTEHAGGADKITVTYNADGSSSITDAQGTTRSQTFHKILGLYKNGGASQPGGSGCGASSSNMTYDANGNVASRTDFKGNTTCYAYDLARNLETVRLEGVAPAAVCPANLSSYVPSTAPGSVERKITTQWHTTLRLPAAIAEPLRISSYTYDIKGNLLSRNVQLTADATGGAGLTAVTAAGTPRTWIYTYNTAGQILSIDGARTDVADVTRYAYDLQGNLTTVSNALNQITSLSNYDAHGHPGSLTDPNGLITSLSYDARGRLLSRSAGAETTRYSYDGVGQLITVSSPSGAVYTYTYDAAHRLTGIADNLGNRINYTLDAMGNRTREQILDGAGSIMQTHSRSFDALNRLYQDIGAVNQTTTYAYDANGNLTNITDPLNHQTVRSYDALNRLVGSTDAANGNTRYGYDALDQLTSVTDPRTLTTQYQRDGLGNLSQQTSPDTGITANTYDAAGNILTRTDAKGQVATYSYDALNRLTGISYSGGTTPAQTVAYQYDQGINGIGHLTGITDITGAASYSYDTHGRLSGETRQPSAAPGTSYTTTYNYDTQGRLNSITYPSGRIVSYTFDTLGRINQIATNYNAVSQVLASNIRYEPFGGVHSYSYGDGLTAPVQTYTRQRDQDGRIASYTLNGKALSIGYDAASQIAFISDPLNLANTTNYSYDPLSRLTGYTQNALGQSYGYDADGNRTSLTTGATVTTYGYSASSNRLSSIRVGTGLPQTLTQDANGATTGDATRQYSYDTRGRLIQTATAQGAINYEINALGLRVRKQAAYTNTDTQYHYDAQGHLIGESPTGSTRFTREYIYLGDQPVAVMQ